MKKLILLLALVGAGICYYQNVYSLPLYGTWAPNEQQYMRQAYERTAMTTDQKKKLRAHIAGSRMTIERGGQIDYQFPDQGGKFSYKLDRAGPGCYSLAISELGNYEACMEGATLKMRSLSSGVVEVYDRVP